MVMIFVVITWSSIGFDGLQFDVKRDELEVMRMKRRPKRT